MKRFLVIIVALLMICILPLSGCSDNSTNIDQKRQDALNNTYNEFKSAFSKDDEQFSLIAEYLVSWAKSNGIKKVHSYENYVVLENPATDDMENETPIVLQCAIEASETDDSLQTLSIGLISLLGPKAHGKITLIVTENQDGYFVGASSVDEKYYKDSDFINLKHAGNPQIYTSGAITFDGVMTSDLEMVSPSYTRAFNITMTLDGNKNPFDFSEHYPNPVEVIGGLLASQKSSGILFQLSSFSCKNEEGYSPSSATAVVVVDENNVDRFTSRFNSSYSNMKKKFEDLNGSFVYTMTETNLPETAISHTSGDNIISLMYTLKTGIFSQDDESGDITAVSDTSFVSTDNNEFKLVIGARGRTKAVVNEMSDAFLITSGLCDIKYEPSSYRYTWTSNSKTDLPHYFTDVLGAESAVHTSALIDMECDVFYSKVPGLNIVSFRCGMKNAESSLTNILNYISRNDPLAAAE